MLCAVAEQGISVMVVTWRVSGPCVIATCPVCKQDYMYLGLRRTMRSFRQTLELPKLRAAEGNNPSHLIDFHKVMRSDTRPTDPELSVHKI